MSPHHHPPAQRRARTVPFGPCRRLQFENRATVRHHVEKILRIECITDPAAVQHEIDAYAHLLPDGTNWKATLFIELADPIERARELPQLSRAVHETLAHLLQDLAAPQPVPTELEPCATPASPT